MWCSYTIFNLKLSESIVMNLMLPQNPRDYKLSKIEPNVEDDNYFEYSTTVIQQSVSRNYSFDQRQKVENAENTSPVLLETTLLSKTTPVSPEITSTVSPKTTLTVSLETTSTVSRKTTPVLSKTTPVSPENTSSVLTILTWNNVSYSGANLPWWREGLISLKTFPSCPILSSDMKCRYVHNQRDLYNTSTAIFISGHTFQSNRQDLPKQPRPSGQLWIYHNLEPPTMTSKLTLPILDRMFNLTSTYASYSDLPMPYGTHCKYAEKGNAWKNETRLELLTKTGRKTSLVAWFSSNCHTKSRREKYVDELRKHIDVDVYGKCGELNCSRGGDSCYKMLDVKYKFYLSFENSFCSDYVTEKFFRILPIDVVPVVLGAADYKAYAPEETFIDVRNFRSPKDLAKYLRLLDSRPDLYANYLLRKRLLVCEKRIQPLCVICSFLHRYVVNTKTSTRILTDFLNEDKLCMKPKSFYESIANITLY